MSKKNTLLALFACISMQLSSQSSTIELTFTAIDNSTNVQLDSIKVMNRTQESNTVLYWPDTVLTIYNVGVTEIFNEKNEFSVFQNYPNPMTVSTTITIFVPEKDEVSIVVTDMPGRVILKSEWKLDRGMHSFRFNPGNGNLFFLTAYWKGISRSIKILKASSPADWTCFLEYTGSEVFNPQIKAIEDLNDFPFNPGDELLYTGYADGHESGIGDSPEEIQTYAFQFATNIPCPGMSTVLYEGLVYNTIQIFSQCWLKENLNVGSMIQNSVQMTDNSILEKYCYNNNPDSCDMFGGLYQWREMMQYITEDGVQGICPPGWHIPTDEEWKVLEGAVDSQYGIGDFEWELYWDYRGYDAGKNLKTTNGWVNNGNGADLYGFSAMPGGVAHTDGYFFSVGDLGSWWTSTQGSNNWAWCRLLSDDHSGIYRNTKLKTDGFNVRCLKDN